MPSRFDPVNELGLTAHGMEQEKRILAALAERTMCNKELAQALGMGRTGIGKYTARMLSATPKRIHIASYHPSNHGGGHPSPIFGPGNGQDAQYVAPQRVPKKSIDRKGDALYRIVKALEKGGTARELESICFLDFTTIHCYMGELRAAGWSIYIKAWKRHGRRNQWAPVYASGNRPDAPRPPQKTRKERYAEERADPEKVRRHENSRRLGKIRRALRAKPAGPFAALGV